jgi:RNA polymerase sigma factor (sigma-70 family)
MDLTSRACDTRTSSDGQLLSRFAASGDQHAFSELIRRHGPMVLRICRRIASGDAHAAEDAAQQVFLTLAERARQLKTRVSVAGWLYRTAWHVATRQRREQGVRADYEQRASAFRDAEAHGGASAEPVPFAVATSELSQALGRALGSLPEDQRNALVLHHLAGHSVAETAAILGVPTGTVASWLSRGRAVLRAQLEGLGFAIALTAIGDWLNTQGPAGGESEEPMPSMPGRADVPGRVAVGAAPVGRGAVAGLAWRPSLLKVLLVLGVVGAGAASSNAAVASVLNFTPVTAAAIALKVAEAAAGSSKQAADNANDPPAASPNSSWSGRFSGGGGSAAVPEPSCGAILLGLGGYALARRRPRTASRSLV